MKSFVEYQKALQGKYNRNVSVHPIGAYMGARGATYATNQFADSLLSITPSHLKNFLEIIKSGRRQGFSELDIVVPNNLDVQVCESFLSLMQRVELSVIRPDSGPTAWPSHWRMNVKFPEKIYEEDVLQYVNSASHLRGRSQDLTDIKNLKDSIAFRERMTPEQKQLFIRAICRDDDPLIDAGDVYG